MNESEGMETTRVRSVRSVGKETFRRTGHGTFQTGELSLWKKVMGDRGFTPRARLESGGLVRRNTVIVLNLPLHSQGVDPRSWPTRTRETVYRFHVDPTDGATTGRRSLFLGLFDRHPKQWLQQMSRWVRFYSGTFIIDRESRKPFF